MVQAYRLLSEEMYTKGWDYPLHLGVTEAGEWRGSRSGRGGADWWRPRGDGTACCAVHPPLPPPLPPHAPPSPPAGEGEDGRMKSAIGIGALLMDGLGDTIRVSLTEDPEYEIDPCGR